MEAVSTLSAVAFDRCGTDCSEDRMLEDLPFRFGYEGFQETHKCRVLFSCWCYYYSVKAQCVLKLWIPFNLMRTIHSYPCSFTNRPGFALFLQCVHLAVC